MSLLSETRGLSTGNAVGDASSTSLVEALQSNLTGGYNYIFLILITVFRLFSLKRGKHHVVYCNGDLQYLIFSPFDCTVTVIHLFALSMG